MQQAPTVSVIIPLYKSKQLFKNIINLTQELFPLLGSKSELLLINDGDSDLFDLTVFDAFTTISRSVTLLSLRKNFGQMTATLCGMSLAKSPIILTIDADFYCDSNVLKELVIKAQASKHIAYIDLQEPNNNLPIHRKVLSWINRKAFTLLVHNPELHAYTGSSIRAIEQSLVERLIQEHRSSELMDVWLLNNALKVSFIPVSQKGESSSSYSITSLISFTFRFIHGLFKKNSRFKATDYIYQIEKLSG
ncbi:MAG: glycosyltransferase [Flavobacteriales bacterium]|nr:glycosyltransferase [Flavobacteriales bacterium]